MPSTSNRRADAARQNGAKSNGPNTPEGRAKCAEAARDAARRRSVAVSLDCTLLPTESAELLHQHIADEFARWQPSNSTEIQLVQELVDINWRIKRIRFAQNQDLISNLESQRQRALAPEISAILIAHAVIEAHGSDGAQSFLDRAVNILAAKRSRILRDLERLSKRYPKRAGSQPALETQHLDAELSLRVPPDPPPLQYAAQPETLVSEPAQPPPAPEITAWAQTALDFRPDSRQAEIMSTTAKNVLVLGARQTGKSAAAAVRTLYEAVHNSNSTVLLAGPTCRQSGQIMAQARAFARRLGLALAAPPPGCDGFRLPNGASVISLPDNQSTVRGFSAPRLIIVDEAAFASASLIAALQPMLTVSNGRMMLLTTPNGDSGYFYEQWHAPGAHWHKITCRAAECPRISPAALKTMRRSLSPDDFRREFNCEFLAPSGQLISRELFRKCLRSDIKPMFEEENG